MDVTTAIARVQTLWTNISGVRAAPAEPPDQLDPFPIAITYERTGTLNLAEMYTGSFAPQTAVLWSELHIARQDNLALAVRAAMTYRVPFLRALQADPNLNSSAFVVNAVRWTFMPMEWNGLPTVGYRFELECLLELTPS